MFVFPPVKVHTKEILQYSLLRSLFFGTFDIVLETLVLLTLLQITFFGTKQEYSSLLIFQGTNDTLFDCVPNVKII